MRCVFVIEWLIGDWRMNVLLGMGRKEKEFVGGERPGG